MADRPEITQPETRERELSSLRKIPDNYEKIIIAMECNLSQDGIKIVGAADFLLCEWQTHKQQKLTGFWTCQLSY